MKNLRLKIGGTVIMFILSMSFLLSCKGQIKQQANSLSIVFFQCQRYASPECADKFFKAFPSDFSEFLAIYGYSDKFGPGPNYDASKDQIDYFFKISSKIKPERFSKKVINICIGGYWDADAVNYLQVGVQDYFCKSSTVVLRLISNLQESQSAKFWCFILDGPVFDNDNYERIKKVLSNYPVQRKIFIDMAKKIRNKS